MTRVYSISQFDKNTKRFCCQIYDSDFKSLSCVISALFSGVSLHGVGCDNFGMPAHFVSVEISSFLSRCQSFLTGRQECFDFECSERF